MVCGRLYSLSSLFFGNNERLLNCATWKERMKERPQEQNGAERLACIQVQLLYNVFKKSPTGSVVLN